jgi:3-dehydroquinate dehydratase-1
VNGLKALFHKMPMICTPLIGNDREELKKECRATVSLNPDLVEWRADWLTDIGDMSRFKEAWEVLNQHLESIPVLVTFRSPAEGGNPDFDLDPDQLLDRYRYVCSTNAAAAVDVEFRLGPSFIEQVRQMSAESGTKLLLSYHDLKQMPSEEEIAAKFEEAAGLSADAVKIAGIPQRLEDVLELMRCSLAMQRFDLPMVFVAAGPLGTLTRVAAWMFGSQITYASGVNSLGPKSGQLPVEDVRTIVNLLQNH